MGKRIAIVATYRYSINANDFLMFFRRSEHRVAALLVHYAVTYRDWWRTNRFTDPAREGVFDPIDKDRDPIRLWYHVEDLIERLREADCDVVCFGNGNGVEQRAAAEAIGRDNCLFSEYGWLPWSRNFYISRGGCGSDSEIASMSAADLAGRTIDEATLDRLRAPFAQGRPLDARDFLYVPLQKDVNDFKFLSAPFRSNEEFLDFLHETTPREVRLLVKPHPLYPKKYDLSRYGRMTDITTAGYRKADLYRKAMATVAINSTSILEALLFDGRVFAYGEDIFLNKGLVHYRVREPQAFARALEEPVDEERCRQFIALLLERQVERARCLGNDLDYVRSHYWSRAL
ncbi:MAG: hypothetical protein KF858_08425 [Candidatus Sumerlaeia bacterium]|nr:hypothetical protein [Candidatus Sumerlaeia bacterium]